MVFTPEQLEKYARVMVWGLERSRSGAFAPGDVVMVRTDVEALPLAETVQAELLARGLHPVVRMLSTPGLDKNLFAKGNRMQITFVCPGDRELQETACGSMALLAPSSLTHLKDVPPDRIAARTLALKFLRDIAEQREAKGLFGWTLCLFPTVALAEAAGMGLAEYTAQIIRAAYLDAEDPVGEWERVFMQAGKVKTWLNGLDTDHYRVRSARVDLKVPRGHDRQWIGVSGHNIPSFELFLSPDWRGVEGVYYADQPSYRSGNLVSGVELRFEKGEVTFIRAEQGEEFVRRQLDMDAGARRLGEFSLTDTRFSRIDRFMAHTLFDENYGGEHGNCHVAVGASYADTYTGNPAELNGARKEALGFNESALHWDLVNTEPKTVTAVDSKGRETVVYENGRFVCGI
ncbi:MAG: aminopeptidase [Deltaproteobacteria bacterium]|nr:aminopeptidase [Deltaproteobacteria bacterium]